MRLSFHGGKCCGIKTIWEFGIDPTDFTPSLAEIAMDNSDTDYHDVKSSQRFFHEAAPEESRLDRLDRYINYVKEHRPQHLVEVVLATSEEFCQDQGKWFPLLEERGFKIVSTAENSNSDNIIHVFHLVIDEKNDNSPA